MSSNSFGNIFRITTFGESHGAAIGVVIDGCPAGLKIDIDFIQKDMDRRKPGQSDMTTQRTEGDKVEIISGVFEGISTGASLTLLIRNNDLRPSDYDVFKGAYRPSHADYTYQQKYGWRDHRGGGRSSARETAARVAAGAVAKLFLAEFDIQVFAFTSRIGSVAINPDLEIKDYSVSETNKVRCPEPGTAAHMIELIEDAKSKGDSLGGVVSCVIKNCPAGLGEPVYDKFDAVLAQAMLSINASKGFEIGLGFSAASMSGSQHNDDFTFDGDKVVPATNKAGGVLGGITTGADIEFRVAFKPTSTIAQQSKLMNEKGELVNIQGKEGRHDPCIVPRAVPVVEAMAALVVAGFVLRNRSAKV